jgi:hypothetical protein
MIENGSKEKSSKVCKERRKVQIQEVIAAS